MASTGAARREARVTFLFTLALSATATLLLLYADRDGSAASDSDGVQTTQTTTSTAPPRAARVVTFDVSDHRITAGERVRMSGRIFSDLDSCEDNELVVLRRRVFGQNEFDRYRTTPSDSAGFYRFRVEPKASSAFQTVVPRSQECQRAVSDAEAVLVRVRVTIDHDPDPVPQGTFFRILGAVRPRHKGDEVVLQRRRGDRWVRLDTEILNGRSRYAFVLAAGWEGERRFRVVWPKQDFDHERGVSRTLRVATV